MIVFGDAIAAAKRTGFDLAGVRRHRNVGNARVFGFARTMTDDRCVIIFPGQIDRRQGLGQGADLVDLDQNGIGDVLGDSLAQKFDVRDKKIVAHQLHLVAQTRG